MTALVFLGGIYAAIGMFLAGLTCQGDDEMGLIEGLYVHVWCVCFWPFMLLWIWIYG